MAIDNMHKKFGDDWTCSSRDMIVDRQTHRQTRSSQYYALPIGGGVITAAKQVTTVNSHKLVIDNPITLSSPSISTARLRNDLYCVEWGVKLYSTMFQQPLVFDFG